MVGSHPNLFSFWSFDARPCRELRIEHYKLARIFEYLIRNHTQFHPDIAIRPVHRNVSVLNYKCVLYQPISILGTLHLKYKYIAALYNA